MKRLLLTITATLAFAAAAMPTNDEVKKAAPTVKELMNPLVAEFRARKKSAVEVGETAMAYAKEADTEGAKFLLLKGAVWYFAQAKDDAKAVAAIAALTEQVKDIPPEVMRNDVLKPAIDNASEQDVPGTFAQFRSASARVEIVKLGPSVRRNKADDPTRRRYAELLAVTGDWKAALEVFAKLEDAKAGQAAKDEIVGKTLATAADFWWDYKPTVALAAEAAKAHAVDLYRKAIASGELTGLKKVVAEKRIATGVAVDGFAVSETPTTPRGDAPVASVKVPANALYCVVDLSAGPGASQYPVKWLAVPPSGGFNKDEYKTAKLVLRRIEPGTFIMGENQKDESHRVKIAKPFYIGIFEVTQKQYELVTGGNPSKHRGDMRPVEGALYTMIRDSAIDEQVQVSAAVDADSFMGKFRARTGLEFDLPTEAQWEYACRAGTTSTYNNGGNTEDDMKQLGRCKDNPSDGKGGYSDSHTTVGSYQPNAWGLYDMHGNVWERCMAQVGDGRVCRGGCFRRPAVNCTSFHRWSDSSLYNKRNVRNHGGIGFRLCMNPESRVGASARGSDTPVASAASATPNGTYKFNYKLDEKGNAILCGSPCVSPNPEGVLVVPDKIDGHTVTKIDNRPFLDCDKVTKIVLPPHLEEIMYKHVGMYCPGQIFQGCFALETIEISKANPKYTSENGILYTKDKKRLIAYPKKRSEITLARETTEVGWHAFESCTFKTIRLPDPVERIGYWAFCRCPYLEVVEFPKSVKWVGPYAFDRCPNMKQVVFHGDAPEKANRRTKGRENLFCGSSKNIVVEVKNGSKGWKAEGSTELPERWPTTGSDSRPIRHIQ